MRMIGLLCVALTLGVSVGCASNNGSENATATPVNSICPIGGHEITSDSPTVAWKGQTIAFCCDGCHDAWNSSDNAERDEILKTALAGK